MTDQIVTRAVMSGMQTAPAAATPAIQEAIMMNLQEQAPESCLFFPHVATHRVVP